MNSGHVGILGYFKKDTFVLKQKHSANNSNGKLMQIHKEMPALVKLVLNFLYMLIELVTSWM